MGYEFNCNKLFVIRDLDSFLRIDGIQLVRVVFTVEKQCVEPKSQNEGKNRQNNNKIDKASDPVKHSVCCMLL